MPADDADDRLAGSIAREPRRGVAGIFSATQIYRLELGAVPAARFFHDTARASANYAVELSPLSPRADARFVIACALVVHIDKYR